MLGWVKSPKPARGGKGWAAEGPDVDPAAPASYKANEQHQRFLFRLACTVAAKAASRLRALVLALAQVRACVLSNGAPQIAIPPRSRLHLFE